MRILITNDDGINAPGLKFLREAAKELSDDIWVAAPDSNQSGVSHALTLSNPLRVQEIDHRVFAVRGTPTDCVIVAVRKLMDRAPDLVLSGINAGQNVADHTTYSGTVAGAMEGAILGIKSIALSQAHDWSADASPLDWSVAREQAPGLLQRLIDLPIPHNSFLNVNFPIAVTQNSEPLAITRQAQRQHNLDIDERVDSNNFPYYWIKFDDGHHELCEQTDLAALARGQISITPVKVDMTDHKFAADLRQSFSKSVGLVEG